MITPRKELFITIKNKLKEIPELEYIDLFRNQFVKNDQEDFPSYWTAALIRINRISWETMTEQIQEGKCFIDVILYCKDGWMDQHNNTSDPEDGLMEIDLLDAIAEKLQFLFGEQFKPIQQTEDETEEVSMDEIMSYRQSFSTLLYRRLAPKYQPKKIQF
jgi:hypothetical protein